MWDFGKCRLSPKSVAEFRRIIYARCQLYGNSRWYVEQTDCEAGDEAEGKHYDRCHCTESLLSEDERQERQQPARNAVNYKGRWDL